MRGSFENKMSRFFDDPWCHSLLQQAEMATVSKEMVYWKPLECNPETMNKLIRDIGVKGVHCEDLFGFDDELLNFIPRPHLALILCFADRGNANCNTFDIIDPYYSQLKKEGYTNPSDVFYMKQKIGNACGTFALLHSLANLRDSVDFGSGAFSNWLGKALPLSVEDRSHSLETDEQMAAAHDSCARAGETEIVNVVSNHFITFVNIKGTLYEFYSSKGFARPIGPTSEATFLKDVEKVVQELSKGLETVTFSAVVLVGDEHE
uniref:Ubiquitin carboxyl-terminal hydrolase n=1 Tax=Panagrolaimus sp. JU765 TaxID=591449 RepID=A0AC34RAV8_9BILA